jgi:hypothetical protein
MGTPCGSCWATGSSPVTVGLLLFETKKRPPSCDTHYNQCKYRFQSFHCNLFNLLAVLLLRWVT